MTNTPRIDLDGLLRAALDAAQAEQQSFRYRFSKAADCKRALVYDAMDHDAGLPPADRMGLKGLLASACGTAVHTALQKGATRLGHKVEAQAVFDTGSVVVKGSLDWQPNETIVADFKIVGENTWKRVQKAPKTEHIFQVNGYAVSQDAPFYAVIYFRGKSIYVPGDVETLVHIGRSSLEKAQELCGVWEEVDTHRKLKTLPERPFGADYNSWPCNWCRHKERCHNPKEQQS